MSTRSKTLSIVGGTGVGVIVYELPKLFSDNFALKSFITLIAPLCSIVAENTVLNLQRAHCETSTIKFISGLMDECKIRRGRTNDPILINKLNQKIQEYQDQIDDINNGRLARRIGQLDYENS